MQLVENVAKVVSRVIYTSNCTAARIVVVIVVRSSIISNCGKVIPLHKTTLINEDGISVLIAVHN